MSTTEESSKTNVNSSRRSPLFSLGILILVLLGAGAHFADMYLLKKSLIPAAENAQSKLMEADAGLKTDFGVSANREFVILGPASGRIEVYTLMENESSGPEYTTVQYFLVHTTEGWQVTETTVCRSVDCLDRSRQALTR
ncbi:MAG: hypothetical protein AMXMBFR84_44420 [Candidatus Hydrogenedentota bacterium]